MMTPAEWDDLRRRLEEIEAVPEGSPRFVPIVPQEPILRALLDLNERVTSLHKWAGPLGELSERIHTLARFRR